MLSQVVIPLKVGSQAFTAVCDIAIAFHIHFFLFHGAPQPFDKDIVQGPAFPIHADLDLMGLEDAGEGVTRILASLIRIKDLRGSILL